MAELVVLGPEADQRSRRVVPDNQPLRVGRATQNEMSVPWDPMISRQHAEVIFSAGRLRVRRLESARNPIYFQGQPQVEFTITDGEEFRIGNTVFRLTGASMDGDISSYEEISYAAEKLQAFAFKNPDKWLDVLERLPAAIAESRSDEDLAQELVHALLEAIPRCNTVAVMVHDSPPGTVPSPAAARPRIMRWDSRMTDLSGFRPSRSLILTALSRGESILHVWNADDSQQRFTYSGSFDWAFCVPLREEACRGWCLYLSGNAGEDVGLPSVMSGDELQEELRFTELVAQLIGAIRQVRLLENQQARVGQFFSPSIRAAMTGADAASQLEAREADITVLFCDLHGGRSQVDSSDLYELLDAVSQSLGIITRNIFEQEGVVADFQGDAALGFWGWPFDVEDGPLRACRAALAIQRDFREMADFNHCPVDGLRLGIGIAHGRAIAGKIGADDQAKVGVFGPVVNVGARLQAMTRHLRAPIVLNERASAFLHTHLPPEEARCRRLGRIRPKGMKDVVAVSQLLPSVDEPDAISDQHLRNFEAAVDAVGEGRWDEALEILDQLPVSDRTKDFMMLFIALNEYRPPPGWDGAFTLMTKK